MKEQVKKILQKLLGFDRYLFVFSIFIIKTLRWNRNERDFLHFLKLIPNEGIILDVGANIGIMTVWLAKFFPTSQIYSFEPIPQNIKALKRIISHFKLKNVFIVEKALGNENRQVEMVMPVLNDVKMQGLSHILHESIDVFNEGNKFTVDMIRLDDLMEIHHKNLKITAIKLDVENFEAFVLSGAKSIIEKHKPIIYTELWENQNRENCFNFVKQFNYSIKFLQNGNLIDFDPQQHKTQNFFFIP